MPYRTDFVPPAVRTFLATQPEVLDLSEQARKGSPSRALQLACNDIKPYDGTGLGCLFFGPVWDAGKGEGRVSQKTLTKSARAIRTVDAR